MVQIETWWAKTRAKSESALTRVGARKGILSIEMNKTSILTR